MLSSIATIALAATAFLAPQVSAQTFTSCNPLNTTCPADTALGTTFNETYSSSNISLSSDIWTINAGNPTFSSAGLDFTINQKGDSPTIQTNFYIFFGRVEIMMRAASGTGIISSIVLLSDDLDEIDWEIMGGNTTSVESNYYGKGDLKQMNAVYFPCDNPQGNYHNYTTVWTPDVLEWWLDGNMVRSLAYNDAVKDGKNIFPQTPSFLRIGNWAGGDSAEPEGTIQWAGGVTDYSQGPFTMSIQSIKITDAHTNASSYSYGDNTGTWQSIKVSDGQSKVAQTIINGPPPSLSQRFQQLPTGAKIGIAAGVLAVVAILFVFFAFFCLRQRREGKKEKQLADAAWEKEQEELLAWKTQNNNTQWTRSSVMMQVPMSTSRPSQPWH